LKGKVLGIILLLLSNTPILADEIDSSLVSFKQNLNNYLWRFILNYSKDWEKRKRLLVVEEFTSSLLKTTTAGNKWKDDQQFKFSFIYNPQPGWEWFLSTISSLYMDRQSVFHKENDIKTTCGRVGLRFKPVNPVKVSLLGGIKWDERFQQKDSGLTYGFDFELTRLNLGGYNNDLCLKTEGDNLGERRERDFSLDYQVGRTFYPETSDSLRFFYGRRRRSYYISTQGDIETREERLSRLDNRLTYKLAPRANLLWIWTVFKREVTIDQITDGDVTGKKERIDQGSQNFARISYQGHRFRASVGISYHTKVENYKLSSFKRTPFSTPFGTLDNESSRFTLHSLISLTLSTSDSLAFYASASRFKYDTPDTTNFDDRDEVRFNFNLVGTHRFSPFLKLELTAGVNLHHLVYIFGERSADNNWTRIFRISPTIQYQPWERLHLMQRFEVLANYVDYDFEQNFPEVRSFAFRKFSLTDSLSFTLTDKTILDVYYRLDLEENGRLLWEEWAEEPFLSRNNHSLDIRLNYNSGQCLSLSSGVTLFRRTEWRYRTDPGGINKEKIKEFNSFGPTLKLRYILGDNLQIRLFASRLAVKDRRREYFIDNFEINLHWLL